MSPSPLLTMFASLAFVLPASAQDEYPNRVLAKDIDSPELQAEVALGLDRLIWSTATTPITFQIKNTSSTDLFTGTLEIRFTDYRSNLILSAPLEIGQNALRRFSYGISLPNHVDFVECRITRGKDILWQRSISFSVSGYNKNTSGTGTDTTPPFLAVSPELAIRPANSPLLLNSGGSNSPTILRVNPWEVPDHDQILTPLGGIFFSEDTDLRAFSGQRLTALARYIAHGGSIVAPSAELPWMEKLVAALPYSITPSADKPTPVGLGLLIPYASDKSSPPWSRPEIQALVTSQPLPNYAGLLGSRQYSVSRGPHALASITAISVFLAVYFIFAGPFLFFFRKVKRRIIVRLLVVIIAGASLATISLGVFLRTSDGDVAWGSVTLVGEGGASQTAIFNLSSGGGRNHHLDLKSPTAVIDPTDVLPVFDYYGSRNRDEGYGTVYESTITAPAIPGPAEITLTPLGKKRIHARAPIPGVLPLELDFKWLPQTKPANTGYPCEITLKNPNPFPLHDPILFFKGSPVGFSYAKSKEIPPGASVTTSYTLIPSESDMSSQLNNYNSRTAADPPYPIFRPTPQLMQQNSSSITLLATLPQSPHFQISGDFEESQPGDHYLIQYFPFP